MQRSSKDCCSIFGTFPAYHLYVKGFKTCFQENGLTNALIIADKGFYSTANVILLDKEGLKYIIPLKRDNTIIEYEKLDRKQLGYFAAIYPEIKML
jgi:transposase